MSAGAATASAPVAASPLLQACGLTRRLGGQPVLQGVDLRLEHGEILGIIGPNGAGKTTLLECLAGLMPIDAGELQMQGAPVTARTRRRTLCYLPDVIAPWGEHPVGELLELYCDLHGTPADRMQRLVRRLQLEIVLCTPARALSKGFRRRFLLALALSTPQPVLMLDEPFDGLDLRQTATVMGVLREEVDRRSLILSIHQLIDAQRICDRLLLLDGGRAVGFGSMAGLQQQAGLAAGSLEEVFLALTR